MISHSSWMLSRKSLVVSRLAAPVRARTGLAGAAPRPSPACPGTKELKRRNPSRGQSHQLSKMRSRPPADPCLSYQTAVPPLSQIKVRRSQSCQLGPMLVPQTPVTHPVPSPPPPPTVSHWHHLPQFLKRQTIHQPAPSHPHIMEVKGERRSRGCQMP